MPNPRLRAIAAVAIQCIVLCCATFVGYGVLILTPSNPFNLEPSAFMMFAAVCSLIVMTLMTCAAALVTNKDAAMYAGSLLSAIPVLAGGLYLAGMGSEWLGKQLPPLVIGLGFLGILLISGAIQAVDELNAKLTKQKAATPAEPETANT